MDHKLYFSASPVVTLATNIFINVPVILKFEDTPLMEIIKEESIGFTTQIPIFHSDGTYLAKVKGNRIFPTADGKKANIKIDQRMDKTICSLDDRIVFEIVHGSGDSFKADAELYAPEGYFVKCTDSPKPELFDIQKNALRIGGTILSGNTFQGFKVGIWIKKDGGCAIGCN